MAEAATLQLVTANRLNDGKVIYFAGNGAWSAAIDKARLVEAKDGAALLAEAQAGPAPHPAVAPVLIDAGRENGRIVPATLRERIRAFGPTISDHRA